MKWWRGDAPPWERWPGVSVRLDAVRAPDGRAVSPCGRYWFDAEAADRACQFFPDCLVHFKGDAAGKAFDLLDWQADLLIRPLFGWRRLDDGARRFRVVFLFIPKKNGKSAIASGLALYLLGPDGEQGAEVFSVAGDVEQGRLVFNEASDMTKASSVLMRHYDVFRTAIVFMRARSKYRVLSSLARTKHGPNIHGLLFDEFHTQESPELYDALRLGIAARRQPVIALLTTAGDRTDTPCHAEYKKAKDVLAGTVTDEQHLPVVFEAPEGGDWTKPETWRVCNPSLGHGVREEFLESECKAAQDEPRKRNAFLRYHLNRWTDSRTQWLKPERWDALAVAEPADLGKLVYCAGVDLSATTDLTALIAIYRRPVVERAAEDFEIEAADERDRRRLVLDFEIYVRTRFWLPREMLEERVKKDRVPYDEWARAGALRVTHGNVVDYDAIRREVVALKERHPHLREIGYDPWNATHFATQMESEGYPMVEVRQGYPTLSPPSKLLEALLASGRLSHDGNPVMRWCVSNCEVQEDPGRNIKPVKPKERHRRIDGVAALVTGLSRLMLAPEPQPSVYEMGGPRRL